MNNPMIFTRKRATFGLAALATAATLTAFSPASAVPSFDGAWSVVITTEAGGCEPTYRTSIRISKGQFINAGNGQFTLRGQVDKDGLVKVTVSKGDNSANGNGRLSAKSGGGTWAGGPCAGKWQAERRS
jgi:hypothetical protein